MNEVDKAWVEYLNSIKDARTQYTDEQTLTMMMAFKAGWEAKPKPFVHIEVNGGVADYDTEGDVDVELIDND